jgi:hypothetical protein
VFSHWEAIAGDRRLVPHKASVKTHDTFGKLPGPSDMPHLSLSEPESGTSTPVFMSATQTTAPTPSAAARRTASNLPLKDRFPHRKLIVVSYNLPVLLRQERYDIATGASISPVAMPTPSGDVGTRWSAAWSAEDFIARSSENSIADEMETIWVGCVTGQCIDRATAQSRLHRHSMPDVPFRSTTPVSESSEKLGGESLQSPYGASDLMINLSEEDKRQIRAALEPMNAVPLFAPPKEHAHFSSYCISVLNPALHNILETSIRDENEFSLAKLHKGFESYKKVRGCMGLPWLRFVRYPHFCVPCR